MKVSKTDAWSLYHAMFKDGDEVIVVSEYDELSWGKILRVTDEHLVLVRPGRHEQKINWDDIRFMAHDGFPAHRLFGADGSQLIEQLDTADVQKAIRESLKAERCNHCGLVLPTKQMGEVVYKGYSRRGRRKPELDAVKVECLKCRKRKPNKDDDYEAWQISQTDPFLIIVGDPFRIEATEGLLLHPGNKWTPGDQMYEETLLVRSKDGANGMLWGLDTCYYFG